MTDEPATSLVKCISPPGQAVMLGDAGAILKGDCTVMTAATGVPSQFATEGVIGKPTAPSWEEADCGVWGMGPSTGVICVSPPVAAVELAVHLYFTPVISPGLERLITALPPEQIAVLSAIASASGRG